MEEKKHIHLVSFFANDENKKDISQEYHDMGTSFIPTVPPVIYQVEIGKEIENNPYNRAMGSNFFLKLVAGFFFHPFSDKS